MPAINLNVAPQAIYLKIHSITVLLSYAAFIMASAAAALYLVQNGALKRKDSGIIFSRLPDLSFLDKLNYRMIGLGLPILTVSILTGFVWANNTRGVYWRGYDSREFYSLVLWLVYALILHVRLSQRLRGRKVALLSLAAFIIIILTLFGKCQ